MIVLAVLIVFILGILAGLTGIGGMLMIPAVIELLDADTHIVSSTLYASFIFSGTFSAWLYSRRGQFDWGIALPLCLGGTICSYVGAQAKAGLSGSAIILILAVIIFLAGLNVLRPPRTGVLDLGKAPAATRRVFLLLLGCVVGFLGGLTGAGGAVLIVPIMVACGFPVLPTVSASMLFSVPSGISGSAANLMNGYIDWTMLAWVTLCLLASNGFGVALSGRVRVERIKLVIAILCIGSGVFIALRSLVFPS